MEICTKFSKPVLLLRPVLEGDTIFYKGSARAEVAEGFNSFKDVLSESGLFEYTQGHANAFGASINEDLIPTLNDYLNNKLKNIVFDNTIVVGADVTDDNWNNTVFKEIGEMEDVWGNGIPEPKFHFKFKTRPECFQVLGGKATTLKTQYKGITFIMFNAKEAIEELANLSSSNSFIEMECIGTSTINEYNGFRNVQIKVDEMELSQLEESISLFQEEIWNTQI